MRRGHLIVLGLGAVLCSFDCFADNRDIDGVWLIEEKQNQFEEAVKAFPLIGLLWKQSLGEANFIIISEKGNGLVVDVPQRQLSFIDVNRNGNVLVGRTTSPYARDIQQRPEFADMRLEINSGLLSGEISYGNIRVYWRGRQSDETVRDRKIAKDADETIRAVEQRVSELQRQLTLTASSSAQRPSNDDTVRALREQLEWSESRRAAAEGEVEALRGSIARPRGASPSPSASVRPSTSQRDKPEAPKPAPPIRSDRVALPVTPAQSATDETPANDRFFVLETPAIIGGSITLPAAGFVSFNGRVQKIGLPLRSLKANGTPIQTAPDGKFRGTIAILTDTSKLAFEAVDRDGALHRHEYTVAIRAPTGG